MARIAPHSTITTPSLDENFGETVREQRVNQRDTTTANQALSEAGIDINPSTQTVNTGGLAKGYNEWKSYMSDFLSNTTERVLNDAVPTFSIDNGKIKITGTEEARTSAIANDAKKALSSALTGVDLSLPAASQVVDEMNKSIHSNVMDYLATQVYGFENKDDYNNYLLAVQEARRENPTNSTYYIMGYDKDGNLVRKTFAEWLDYWKEAYSTDERVDLFTKSAASNYGYDRIPYIIMSGGGDRGNAVYGFDTGENLSLGVYAIGQEITKLPHGLTQQISETVNHMDDILKVYSMLDFTVDPASNKEKLTSAPQVTEEEFNRILEKYKGHGPVKGGISNLTDEEKIVLALASHPSAEAQLNKDWNNWPIEKKESYRDRALENADYETYKKRSDAFRNYAFRARQMSDLSERIDKNMAVYGGDATNFVSRMMGIMARQAIEAYLIKAATGGKFNPNSVGEELGEAISREFGVNAAGKATLLGTATGKSVAQFLGGVPEDILQDLIDAKLTQDSTISDGVFTAENVVQNLAFRLAFNAIVKMPLNVVRNARAFKAMSDAARKAGVDLDADDLKRSVSEAYEALKRGGKIEVDDDGKIIFHDENGNVKTYDNVNVFTIQGLTGEDASAVIDDAVKAKAQELTEEWRQKQADKANIRSAELEPIRNTISGEITYTAGTPKEASVPQSVKRFIANHAYSGVDEGAASLVSAFKKYAIDAESIKNSIDSSAVDEAIKYANRAFGVLGAEIPTEPRTLKDLLSDFFGSVLKLGGVERGPEFDNGIDRALDAVREYVVEGKEAYSLEEYLIDLFNRSDIRTNIAISELTDWFDLLKDDSQTKALKEALDLPEDKYVSTSDIRRELSYLLSRIVSPYIEAYSSALDKIDAEAAVDIISSAISDLEVALDKAGDEAKAANKAVVESLSNMFDSVKFQMEYNQHLTELPEYVLGDIHSSNELGEKLNAQKLALMDIAKTMTPEEFVFGKMSIDDLTENLRKLYGLDMFPFDLTNDGNASIVNMTDTTPGAVGKKSLKEYSETEKGESNNVILMRPQDYLNILKFYGNLNDDLENNMRAESSTAKYADAMYNGDKFPVPYIKFRYDESGALVLGGQEGRHRAIAAQMANIDRIPVAIKYPNDWTLKSVLTGYNDWTDITEPVSKINAIKNSELDGKTAKTPEKGSLEWEQAKQAEWKNKGKAMAEAKISELNAKNKKVAHGSAEKKINSLTTELDKESPNPEAVANKINSLKQAKAAGFKDAGDLEGADAAIARGEDWLKSNGYEVVSPEIGSKYTDGQNVDLLTINENGVNPESFGAFQIVSEVYQPGLTKINDDGTRTVIKRPLITVDRIDTGSDGTPEGGKALSPEEGALKDAQEAFTQNELLEIWTESRYRAMTVQNMLNIMEKEFTDQSSSVNDMPSEGSRMVENATHYTKYDIDRMPLDFWFEVTERGKSGRFDTWLSRLEASGNPAFYKSEGGAPSKVSGRSLLEMAVLQNPKLWAASLIRLKSQLYKRSRYMAEAVAHDIRKYTDISLDEASNLAKVYKEIYKDNITDEAKTYIANQALGIEPGTDGKTGMSDAMRGLADEFEKETSLAVKDNSVAFVGWLAEKYTLNKQLYQLKEYESAASMPMAKFLDTPITVARTERVWGPGRRVLFGMDAEAKPPTFDLSTETTLGFSVNLWGVATGNTGVGPKPSDAGSIVIRVRPIDMIGDLASIYDNEFEVFVRKSLVYPAGNKMHSIFFDGVISTTAENVLKDKNARMFQVDESLVINYYDFEAIKNTFKILDNMKKHSKDGVTYKQVFDVLNTGVIDEDVYQPNKENFKSALKTFRSNPYSTEIGKLLESTNPFVSTTINAIMDDISRGTVDELGPKLSTLFGKPFVITDWAKGTVSYTKGIVPQLDNEIATNGGTHLNDTQAKRKANADVVLEDWRDAANKQAEEVKNEAYEKNQGLSVDGNTVSYTALLNRQDILANITNADNSAADTSTKIAMDNRLESEPKDAPTGEEWNNPEHPKYNSFAEALADRPTYRNAQDFYTWMPAAVDAGVNEFRSWKTEVFDVAHSDVDQARLVETWDFINYLAHQNKDTDGDMSSIDIDNYVGKKYTAADGSEVEVTQQDIAMYLEFDEFVRKQGARMAALKARGFVDDYNQLGYLPHTDYNPMEQTAEAMIQGALWKKNRLKNSTGEDGTFTTLKLDNNWENRYRVWLSNMAFDSLGDVAPFGEKMRELIADGVIEVKGGGTGFKDKDGNPVEPQKAIADAIGGDKKLNERASKATSAKDFNEIHVKQNKKIDFKELDKRIAEDAEKLGYSEALHNVYGDVYGNSRASVVAQKNVASNSITGLYDFMRGTVTSDGSLLNNGGELLINPNGIAKEIIRRYRAEGNLKNIVVDVLTQKSGRTQKGAEYIYNKWLPDIQKHVKNGRINSTMLSAVLTKHLRYEAWTAIKKWLARADYDKFNGTTKKRLDNILYRHNLVVQVSNNPSVMKTINKALNSITSMRHRALFWLNPKNALLQLSECIRLFTEFKLGDATKTLRRLSTDADFRNSVAEWKDILFPDGEPLQNVEPMADAWGKTAGAAKYKDDGTLDLKNTVKGGIQEADAVMMAPINAAEDMKNTTLIAGILQEMETKKANGTLKEPEYDFMMRRFQRIGLANDEFGRLGYSDNPFARTLLYLQNFSIRQLKMFGDNIVDTWGNDGAAKAFGYILKTFGWRMGLFLVMAKLGYSAGQILGYDPFDMLSDTYTGLDEEDETELDKQIKSGILSPLFTGGITSLIQSFYFAGRQAYERSHEDTPSEEAGALASGEESWGWEFPGFDWASTATSWAPGGGAAKRWIQMNDLMNRGVALSQSGTKMYEAPDNILDVIAGYTFGRSNTSNARAYYQTPDPLQGIIDNGLGGFAQQMGRAFSSDFREFDPIDKENFSDWFDGSEADEQQWQSGYYYYRNRAREIYEAYNGQNNSFIGSDDYADLKSGYREEMEKLGEELNRFSQAYIAKHGALGGRKMQQLLNILNDSQINMLMTEQQKSDAEMEGLRRAQERYAQAGLPAETRHTGPSTGSPDTEYQTKFSPQYYNAVQGVYGGSSEAAKILQGLYDSKWKQLRKQYSDKAYADGISFNDREKIQNEYIKLVRQDLDGVIGMYGTNIIANDAVDDVLTDVFSGMIPYGEYNVNKKGRRVSLPQNVEVDVSDWLKSKYANASKAPAISYDATTKSAIDKIKQYQDQGKNGMAKGAARMLLQRIQDNRASATRSEIEWLQGVIND